MRYLYNLGIIFYQLLIFVVAPFNKKAKLFIDGRRNWRRALENMIGKQAKYLWFHCASLGEFEQGRPLIEAIKKQFPEFKILLTFFSPSGYEIRKNYAEADVIFYLPMDTPSNARDFYNIVRPEKVFFIKYEFWFNFIREAKMREIPIFVISCIFRKEQLFFKHNFVSRWYRKTLGRVTRFFVQNEKSADLLAQFGFTNATVSGDTRFDRVATIARSAKKIPLFEKYKGNNPLLITGSSWPPDEELIVRYINQSEGIKFIIAPHEVSGQNIKRISASLKKRHLFYSEIRELSVEYADVIIIDSIGLLSSLYRYGDVAYIGGGFGVGIHNILEAATFGLPVIFGPNYKKFNEAVELEARGGAFPVSDYEELEQILSHLLLNSDKLGKLSGLVKKYIDHNIGATQVIMKNTLEN